MLETIPLFPLGSVLFPRGRMPLQVFEPRYLDLVSSCLKSESGFGVPWLREGSEVYQPNQEVDPRLAQVGTYAKIVDWNSLPNGLLGITIEGEKKFRLLSSYQADDHLHMAEVEWIEEEPVIALPQQSLEMKELLDQLLQHPHIERLNLNPIVEDVSTLGFLLTQFLPIAESSKFSLLALPDPVQRLHLLTDLLDELSG